MSGDPNDDGRARELAAGIGAWVVALCADLDFGDAEMKALPYVDAEAPALPFVLTELLSLSASAGDDRFARVAIQQADLVVYEFEVTPIVDWRDPDRADATLKTIVARMRRSLWADATLGGRMQTTSRDFRASFDEPLVKWESGEIGRQAVTSLLVGDLVQDPDTPGPWWQT